MLELEAVSEVAGKLDPGESLGRVDAPRAQDFLDGVHLVLVDGVSHARVDPLVHVRIQPAKDISRLMNVTCR